MLEVTRKLVELLDLSPLGDDHFQGESEDLGFPQVFGGQVLGQGLMAASRTVEGRLPHSLHAYFLRPGRPDQPIDYEVQRVRDGGSFTVRRVIARQDGKEILTGSVSFQDHEDGLEHQLAMPAAPAYDTLKSEHTYALMLKQYIPEHLRDKFTRERPIEIRPVDPMNPLKPEPKTPVKQSWFRAQGELPDDQILHRCLLAYTSDFGLLGTAMNPHGVTFMSRGMKVASLDHAIWFHRDLRMDDWLLYDMDSPSSSGGRGFTRGNIYNQAGVLVASTCQEGLIRKRAKPATAG
ncbi:MAG: acyl-CoA thioesterase II [Marinobacter sp.]|nr:acyl-CoA thioesterase II [Marinobacter sp.]